MRAGHDTDTVAAIAGGLLGAAYGASAVPLQWRGLLHGWPLLYRNTFDGVRLEVSFAADVVGGPIDYTAQPVAMCYR